jgi:outer membrane protein assembly factor BamB
MTRVFVLSSLLLGFAVPGAAPSAAVTPAGGDWSQWRGPNRDGVSSETGLLDRWTGSGPPLMWQAKGLGNGYSSVAIADGTIFTMGKRGRGEHLIALKADDGSERWATRVGGGDHSNSTPTVDGPYVYALSLDGNLVCLEATGGKLVWRKNFQREFRGRMMSGWGYSESVLIDGDRLICTPGGQSAIMAALDKRTGETIWTAEMPGSVGNAGSEGAGYSSIVVSEGADVRQYVQLVGRGLIGVAADDGRVLWTYNRIANGTANIPTAIASGDFVFCSSGYGTGAALLKLVATRTGVDAREVYFLSSRDMQNHHGGMILVGDHIYCGHGHNQGFPLCIEMRTGKAAWKPGRGPGTGSASIAYADGDLYFRYENGVMALIEATPRRYNLKGTFKLASVDGPSWPHPVISDGRLYLRDQDVLLCYDVRDGRRGGE